MDEIYSRHVINKEKIYVPLKEPPSGEQMKVSCTFHMIVIRTVKDASE
jgi:hypothetical protein